MGVGGVPGRAVSPRLASYEEARARYRVEVPERYNAVRHVVEGWAAEQPDAPALVSIDGAGRLVATHTIAERAREAPRVERLLQALAVRKGDAVCVMLPRIPAWCFAMLAAMRIGAVAKQERMPAHQPRHRLPHPVRRGRGGDHRRLMGREDADAQV